MRVDSKTCSQPILLIEKLNEKLVDINTILITTNQSYQATNENESRANHD